MEYLRGKEDDVAGILVAHKLATMGVAATSAVTAMVIC